MSANLYCIFGPLGDITLSLPRMFPHLSSHVHPRTHFLSVMPRNPNAYVRPMKPSELPQVIDLLTRAFINDPTMCYYGRAPALVKDPTHPTPSEQKTIRELAIVQGVLAKVPMLVGGIIDVVAVPTSFDNSSDKSQRKTPAEEVTAVALWLPPGVDLDFTLPTMLRAGVHKLILAWGFTALKVRFAQSGSPF